MQNVVVAYDGSDESKRALERAAAIGKGGGSVTVVTAVEIGAHSGARSMGVRDEDAVEAGRETLAAAKADLTAQGLDVHTVEGEGDPAAVIMEVAKEKGADLIVVGTRGHGGAKRLVLGSVSKKLVHEAPCDVLVVR